MGTPLAPAKINLGDKVKDTWIVKKKLGEGSCGIVFLVQHVKLGGNEVGYLSFNNNLDASRPRLQ
jgi:tau tubulin kinase